MPKVHRIALAVKYFADAVKALALVAYYFIRAVFDRPTDTDLEDLASLAQMDPDTARETAYMLCHAVGSEKMALEYELDSSDRRVIAEKFAELYREPVRAAAVDGALKGLFEYDEQHV